jgi:hypothetical protein
MSMIGFLIECGPKGLEDKMIPKFCQLIAEDRNIDIDPTITTMSNKKNLLEQCGNAAASLLKDGCSRVIIVWDERPTWPNKEDKLCWHNERNKIISELEIAGVDIEQVGLVCIEREFEAWLLSDNKMLSAALSRRTHPFKAPKQNNAERIPNPTGVMNRLFNMAGRGPYNDAIHAALFVENITSLAKLRKCDTFKRFERKVCGD